MNPEIRNIIISQVVIFTTLTIFAWVSEEHTFMSIVVPAFVAMVALIVAIVGPIIICIWYDSRKGI